MLSADGGLEQCPFIDALHFRDEFGRCGADGVEEDGADVGDGFVDVGSDTAGGGVGEDV